MMAIVFKQLMMVLAFLYILYKTDLIDLEDKKTFFISGIYVIIMSLYYSSDYAAKIGIQMRIIQNIIYYGSFLLMALCICRDKKVIYWALCVLFIINYLEHVILFIKFWYWYHCDILYIAYIFITMLLYRCRFFTYSKGGTICHIISHFIWFIILNITNFLDYYHFIQIITVCFIAWLVSNKIISKHLAS